MTRFRCLILLLACSLFPVTSWADDPTFSPEKLEFFEKQVRPILVARCYECHSGKTPEPKSGLRVDSRAALLKGGDTDAAIVPGNAKKSLLIDAINYGDTFQMPKKSKMPAEEIAVLTRWVDMGAPWTPGDKPVTSEGPRVFDLAARKAEHWCWRDLSNPPVPPVKNQAWPADDLDRFLLAKIEEQGFVPAKPAEKRSMLRRVYFDLIGLPPTPSQVKAFVEDESPHALAKVIDELLKSPHFGERWGRHWLDLTRYAESRGHEFDYNAPNAYQYRDYVIRALNDDLPYNDFVIEQVAGDLLPKPRTNKEQGFNESILGTGFWFLGEWIHSPVDIRKDECDRFDNMVDVFSKTFTGLTVACARCHDHKFDAISQADYYALFGYLQSSSYRLARFDTMLQEDRIAKELEELNKKFEPEVIKAIDASQAEATRQIRDYLRVSRTAIQGNASGEGLALLATQGKLDLARLEKWIAAIKSATHRPDDLLHVWAKICETKGDFDDKFLEGILAPIYDRWEKRREEYAKSIADGEMIVDYAQSSPEQWLTNGVSFGLHPVKKGELLWSNSPAQPVIGFAEYAAARRDPTWNVLKAAPGTEQDVGKLGNIDRAGKTIRTPTFTVGKGLVHYLVRGAGHAYAAMDSHSVIAGPLHGQIQLDFDKGDGNLRWITHDLRPYQGHRVHVEFSPHADQPLEVLQVVQSDRAPPLPPPSEIEGFEMDFFFAVHGRDRSIDALAVRYDIVLGNRPDWLFSHRDLVPADESKTKDIFARYAAERKKITDRIKPESRYAMAMWDGPGEDEVLLLRGNPRTPGEVVPRRMLTALGGTPKRSVSEEARRVSEGSGRLEMARDLVDPKKNPLVPRVLVNRVWHHLFGRGIVPSVDNFGVLGQSPTHPELLDHLATRFVNDGWSTKRLIRTMMLSRAYQMSSTITDARAEEADPKNLLWRRTNIRRLQAEAIRDELLAISGRLDGSNYGPSVPVHLTAFLQGRGRPADGPLDGNGRRSIYLSVRRNFLSPMMLAFDAPIPFSTMGARNVSNVPAQALILMNDPFVLQQAELWAKRALAEPNQTSEQRIAAMYEAAYARPATAEEIAAAQAFLESQAKEYGLAAAGNDLRVWTDLAHVLVNAKEFIFLN